MRNKSFVERNPMYNRYMRRCWAVLVLALLAACGNQTPATSMVPTTGALPTRAPAAPPTAAAMIAPTAADAPTPTAAPTAGATQPENAAAAIPNSLTSEGYHVLGRPDAPVTLVMYSDFL
jgi:protein-disulfide isomerase